MKIKRKSKRMSSRTDTAIDIKDSALQQAFTELVEMGLIRDSGRQRNGRVVWVR